MDKYRIVLDIGISKVRALNIGNFNFSEFKIKSKDKRYAGEDYKKHLKDTVKKVIERVGKDLKPEEKEIMVGVPGYYLSHYFQAQGEEKQLKEDHSEEILKVCEKFTKPIKDMGYLMKGYYPAILAAGKAVLTEKEKKEGSLLVSIKEKTTDFAFYLEDKVYQMETILSDYLFFVEKPFHFTFHNLPF